MRCPNCSAINAPDARVCAECGQRLIESSEPSSCLGMTCGILLMIVSLPVGLCGIMCAVTGIEATRLDQGDPSVLLIGLTLTGMSVLFIYLAIRFMKGR